jgi:hypothetical protein
VVRRITGMSDQQLCRRHCQQSFNRGDERSGRQRPLLLVTRLLAKAQPCFDGDRDIVKLSSELAHDLDRYLRRDWVLANEPAAS